MRRDKRVAIRWNASKTFSRRQVPWLQGKRGHGALLRTVRIVALDINGTLIDGRYKRWTDIFENELNLERRENAPPLQWYAAQTGRLSFQEMLNLHYVADRPGLAPDALNVYMEALTPREGCYRLLEDLQRRYDLVVCSDTSGVTKAIAKRFDLERYFLASFYSLDVGWMKSDMEYWTKVLTAFPGTGPDAFVMVGDNPQCDVHWPNFLGMTTIQIKTTELLSRRSFEVDDEPDYSVTRLDEIADLLAPPIEPG